MATVTLFPAANASLPDIGMRRGFVVPIRLDFSVVARAASDVLEIWEVPANTHIRRIVAVPVTVEGGTLTVDIGDDTDPNGWHDALDLNATTVVIEDGGGAAYTTAFGKYYATAETLIMTLDNAADTAVVNLFVEGYNLNFGTLINWNKTANES